MEKILRIVGVGDNCIDAYDQLGEAYPGGNPVNVAVYMKRLGGEASYVGHVGTDDNGSLLIEALKNKGVDTSYVHIVDGKTAVTHVEIRNGERILGDYDEGVMEFFHLKKEDVDFILTHDLVISALWGRMENEMKLFRDGGIRTAFDFATQLDGDVVNAAIGYIDYAFFSAEEMPVDELKECMATLFLRGPKLVIMTMGEKGSMVYDGTRYYQYGIEPCQVVDTMGAGDSYIAGFLYGILQGKSIEESMKLGAKSSAVTLSYWGAW